MANTSYKWQPRFEENLVVGHDATGNSFGFPRRPDARYWENYTPWQEKQAAR
ncbi:hypothetical protein [Paraflavitalea speifideaquila]|uniref:hypothetical protein n=1 Tax=Paraflavitalea speifideaquila TaxID=3076558 RepID=UPI0028E57AAD|nr:hypothetical protein [Paraflavitalea speifideiaquila]